MGFAAADWTPAPALGINVLVFMRPESLQLTDLVLIVLRRDDVAQLVEGHQRFADDAGIAVLRCSPVLPDLDGSSCRYRATETPAPLPRTYDVRSPEVTRDMAETIRTYFDSFQSEGELRIESNARGLWFMTPWGQRPFIGLARLHVGPPAGQTLQHDSHPERSETLPCAPLRPR